MIGITKDNIIIYHKKIMNSTGGSAEVRDLGLIEIVINRGNMTFDGDDLYQTDIDKISSITH